MRLRPAKPAARPLTPKAFVGRLEPLLVRSAARSSAASRRAVTRCRRLLARARPGRARRSARRSRPASGARQVRRAAAAERGNAECAPAARAVAVALGRGRHATTRLWIACFERRVPGAGRPRVRKGDRGERAGPGLESGVRAHYNPIAQGRRRPHLAARLSSEPKPLASIGRDGRRSARALPRGPQPGPAGGRAAHRGAAARRRRSGLGQDPCPDLPRRAPDLGGGGAAERDPRDHVHEQGRGRDALAGREDARRRGAAHLADDLPLGVRPHPASRGGQARLQDELHHLRPGRPGTAREGLSWTSSSATRSASCRAGIHSQISSGEEPADRPGRVPQPRAVLLRPDRRRRVRAVPAAPVRLERGRLRRHADAHGRRPRALPRGAREVAEGVPLRPRRRVPGHEPRAVPAAPAPGRKAQEPLRRRRPGPVDLRLPRSRHPQHPGVRARLPGRAHDRARAELPLDEPDPARRQRRDRAQPRAQGEAALLRARRRRAGRGARGRGRARRGALRRRPHRRARRGGHSTAARSRSSTGRTRSRGCWRTCSSARASRTR